MAELQSLSVSTSSRTPVMALMEIFSEERQSTFTFPIMTSVSSGEEELSMYKLSTEGDEMIGWRLMQQ